MFNDLDINSLVGYQVQNTAEWRREKALQFPDDARNLSAAEELERLAQTIEALEGSEIHRQLNKLQDQINSVNSEIWIYINEAVSAELRAIGFHVDYETAQQFLEWYRDLLHDELRRHIAANINEQVEDDPAVKAAKQVYEAARMTAYLKARKPKLVEP